MITLAILLATWTFGELVLLTIGALIFIVGCFLVGFALWSATEDGSGVF